jgi:hypothetical protein
VSWAAVLAMLSQTTAPRLLCYYVGGVEIGTLALGRSS